MEKIDKIFKWDYYCVFKAIVGVFLSAFATNLFIVPNHLYNGGTLGIAQLIRTFILSKFVIDTNIDIASIIYYLINVSLFILAYKKISKTFFARTLFCVTLYSLFLAFLPTISEPLVDEVFVNILIGGILDGLGCGLALSSGASTGGTDIIGIIITMKNKYFSVGIIGFIVNAIVYGVSGLLYGVKVMVYSILLAIFSSITIDKTHEQNICSTAFIFTKKDPKKILDFIIKELDRDATYWKAIGAYENTNTYIIYTALSKYELSRLERHMNDFDKDAFLIKSDGVNIKGEFDKKF